MMMIVPRTCSCHKQTFLRQKVTLASSPTANGAGVLRYALHTRFVCPLPKKNSRSLQRCKSDPFSAPARNDDIDGERRFYLYNDLRVVFPQRHSDADEGKVCHIHCLYLVNFLVKLHFCLSSMMWYTKMKSFKFCFNLLLSISFMAIISCPSTWSNAISIQSIHPLYMSFDVKIFKFSFSFFPFKVCWFKILCASTWHY